MTHKEHHRDLESQNQELRFRLQEAEEMLQAIRNKEVDALVVDGPNGLQVYTLEGADRSYKIFVETMSEGALTITPDGTILHCNNQFALLSGRPLNKVIGNDLYNMVDPVGSKALEPMIRSCPRKGCRSEFSLKGTKGAPIPILISAKPVMLETEVFCLVVTDMSVQNGMQKKLEDEIARRLMAENELRASHADLEDAYQKLIKETKDKHVLEERLRHAQKMESLGTLTGGIAHDFNNILAAILGFAEMSRDDAPRSSQQERNLKHIITSCFRGRDLIQQMLTFSRKTDSVKKPLSLSPVVTETIKLLRASLPSSIELTLSKKTRHDTVNANPTEIQQIIMNLCTNSAQAMPDTQGKIEVLLTNSEVLAPSADQPEVTPGTYFNIFIKDTGKGMEPLVIRRIFEPFYTTKEIGKGTGMGLAVVYGIVTGLNGRISVDSTPGKGTTFHIMLPVVETKSRVERVDTDLPRGRGEKILFIDDDELLVELAKGMLERLGYEVTSMTDSEAAFALFAEDPSRFDLVFTDQTMSKITGLKLAQELKKLRSDIPVILYTGHSDVVSSEAIERVGIKGSLMKPLTKQETAKAVRRVLDEAKR
jgi:signal transduction histidine kinase/ActR/RegA family two-component response regulator